MTEQDATDDDDIDGDIIPEDLARRRGMEYRKNSRGHVYEAHLPAPLLIDELYRREALSDDHHFHGVQLITMRKVFLQPVSRKSHMLRIRQGDEAATDKPVFIQDTDYLHVLREIRNPHSRDIVRDVCDEGADPWMARFYLAKVGQLMFAFDAMVNSVRDLREKKRRQEDQ